MLRSRSLLALLLAPLLGGCGHVPKKIATPALWSDAATCEANGGRIQDLCGWGYSVCATAFADGGKPCADGSECMGGCIVPASQRSFSPGEKKGACAPNTFVCECYRVVKHGKVQRAGFCPA